MMVMMVIVVAAVVVVTTTMMQRPRPQAADLVSDDGARVVEHVDELIQTLTNVTRQTPHAAHSTRTHLMLNDAVDKVTPAGA